MADELIYRVTASALNLRTEPSAESASQGLMSTGARVTALQPGDA